MSGQQIYERPLMLTNWEKGQTEEEVLPGHYDEQDQVWKLEDGSILAFADMGHQTTWDSTVTSKGDQKGDPREDA